MAKKKKPNPKGVQVYCLCIDMIRSTELLQRVSTAQLDRFNTSLVSQLKPHLENLELNGKASLLKFTGDGWLVMSDVTDRLLDLAYLALIMSKTFQKAMREATGLAVIPAVRISICAGRDVRVQLPNGNKDYVGDSARRAVRANGLCRENEILVDSTVSQQLSREFNFSVLTAEEVEARSKPPVKWEENFALFKLETMKQRAETTTEWEDSDHFLYTLSTLGDSLSAQRVIQDMPVKDPVKISQMIVGLPNYDSMRALFSRAPIDKSKWGTLAINAIIAKAPDYVESQRWWMKFQQRGLKPDISSFNIMITNSPNFATARKWSHKISASGLKPNLVTLNALISKAESPSQARDVLLQIQSTANPDQATIFTLAGKLAHADSYEAAREWFTIIMQSGLQPDSVMFNNLMAKANYKDCLAIVAEMKKAGAKPDVFTFNTLIAKAPSYTIGAGLIGEMKAAGIAPHPFSFAMLFKKNLNDVRAEKLLHWFDEQGASFEDPLQSAIASYRIQNLLDDACFLAWHYPHLTSARKLFRENSAVALRYLTKKHEENPEHRNIAYALGVAYYELGDINQALINLRKALVLATAPQRKTFIERLILEMERKAAGS